MILFNIGIDEGVLNDNLLVSFDFDVSKHEYINVFCWFFVHRQIKQVFLPLVCPLQFYRSVMNKSTFGVLLDLLKKVCSNFQVRSPGINEFECLKETPLVLFHEVENTYHTCPALSSDRVDKDRITLWKWFIYKPDYFFGDLVFIIENQLPVVINPIESEEFQISLYLSICSRNDSMVIILNLFPCTIDDMIYLIQS